MAEPMQSEQLPRRRLAALRRSYLHRSTGLSGGDRAYLGYLLLLLTATLGVPLLRAVALGLAQPEVLALLGSEAATGAVALSAAAVAALMTAVGGIRGPVMLNPFLTGLFTSAALPRRLTLRRPWLNSALVLLAVVLTAAALPAFVLASAQPELTGSAVLFALAAIPMALLLAALWLLGQRLTPRPRMVAAVLLLLAGALALLPGTALVSPFAWFAGLWPGAVAGPWWPAAALALLTLAAVLFVPRLLDGLHAPSLLEQARNWEAAGVFSASGDLARAVAPFRVRPSAGRRWQAARSGPGWLRWLVADGLGAARMPLRSILGMLLLIAAGAAAAAAPGTAEAVRWVPAVLAAALGYAGAGVFCDGLRHGVDVLRSPALYRASRLGAVAARMPLPLLCAAAGMLAGAAGAVLLLGAPAAGLAVAALLAPLLCGVRMSDAAKGPLPLVLLAPVPTPFGDASALMVLIWMADALIVSGVLAIAVVLLLPLQPVVACLGAAGALLLLALLTWRRIATS